MFPVWSKRPIETALWLWIWPVRFARGGEIDGLDVAIESLCGTHWHQHFCHYGKWLLCSFTRYVSVEGIPIISSKYGSAWAPLISHFILFNYECALPAVISTRVMAWAGPDGPDQGLHWSAQIWMHKDIQTKTQRKGPRKPLLGFLSHFLFSCIKRAMLMSPFFFF